MKKIFLILLSITLLIKKGQAQTYRQLFDNWDNTYFRGVGYYSEFSNMNTLLAFNAGNVMQAYLNMYQATKDLKYLHEFAIHAKRTMDRRDDHIASASPVPDFPHPVNACNITSVPLSFINTGYPAWSRMELINNNNLCQLVPFPHFMETGGIVYPMAQFVLLTMEDPSFASVSLPAEAAFGTVATFGDFATWLKGNIYQSLDWQISTDYNRSGTNSQGCNGGCDAFVSQFSNGWHDINQQCAIGLPI
ncbi:MAG: hypothetical protein ACXVP0_18670, partial [Bacteroidia bacterium]